MREIEFRALKDDMSNCNFVYGDLAYKSGGVPIIKENIHSKLFTTCLIGTEGQYIRKKDKNLNKIFEGDIVKWDDCSNGKYWRVAVVEINPDIQFRIIENTLYPLSREKGYIFHYGNFSYIDTEKYLTIIGNIHENPELLKP